MYPVALALSTDMMELFLQNVEMSAVKDKLITIKASLAKALRIPVKEVDINMNELTSGVLRLHLPQAPLIFPLLHPPHRHLSVQLQTTQPRLPVCLQHNRLRIPPRFQVLHPLLLQQRRHNALRALSLQVHRQQYHHLILRLAQVPTPHRNPHHLLRRPQ